MKLVSILVVSIFISFVISCSCFLIDVDEFCELRVILGFKLKIYVYLNSDCQVTFLVIVESADFLRLFFPLFFVFVWIGVSFMLIALIICSELFR